MWLAMLFNLTQTVYAIRFATQTSNLGGQKSRETS